MQIDREKKSNPFDYGLRSRLLLLLVVMLLPFIIFSLYQAYHSYNHLTQEILTGNARDAVEIANNIDELVQSTADLLIAISNSQPAREQDFAELKRWFNEISTEYPYYKNIIFVDLDGNIRAAAHTYTKPDGKIIANVKETTYYRRSLKATDLAFGDFMYAILSHKPVIHITYPVYERNERLGFVAVAFDLSRLQERIVTVNTSKESEISILDQNGTIIARTLEPQQWVGKSIKSCDVFTAVQSGSKNITAPGPDGVIRLTSFSKTKQTPWLVAVCFDEAAIRSQALSELLRQLALFIPLLLIALVGWLWIGRDVDGRYKAARRLSLADPMTSLGSFQKFNQDLAKDIARARRQMELLSLILLDIDGFRQFNEGNGYQYGNRALAEIASIVKQTLRDTDFAYRYGGDEISIILVDTDELDAQEFAEKIQAKVTQSRFETKYGQPAGLSISIGIASYPSNSSDAESLVQCAAEALFEAKAGAGGNIITYSQTLRPRKVKEGTG